MKLGKVLARCILPILVSAPFLVCQQQPTSDLSSTVPRLMKFSGVVSNRSGPSHTGVAGVTFSFYKDQEGGAPLWIETQNVKLDSTGHYTAVIGETKAGLPMDLFASGEARWLGVQVEGQAEQPRMLLLSVPYALKAAEAETLGGKPASAFALAAAAEITAAPTSATTPSNTSMAATPGGPSRGTPGYIARWTGNKTLGNAILFFQDAAGRVGIGTITPQSLLVVNGIEQVGAANSVSPAAMLVSQSNSHLYAGLRGAGSGDTLSTTTASSDGVDGIGGDSNGPNNFSAGSGLVGTGGIGDKLGAPGGNGVVGNGGSGTPAGGTGVVGMGGSGGGGGVEAIGGSGAPDGPGIFATNVDGGTIAASGSYAGDFIGDLNVTGTIFAGTKDFRIDHPLDPANKYLLHASVESSEMMNLYTGNVILNDNGEAVVHLPDWFEAVNGDFRYQLTAVGASSPGLYIAKEVNNHQFKIAGGKAGMKVSWQVTAVRRDAYAKSNPLVVEQPKGTREHGYYIHPELYGAPGERGIEWARHRQLMRRMQQLRTGAVKFH